MRSPLPTRHRKRLPRSLSYPLGAKAISEALAPVPQFGLLSITFTWHDEGGIRLQAQSTKTLHVEYHRNDYSKLYSAPRFRETTWKLAVHAVRAEDSAKVRSLLLGEGLAAVRAWLCAARTDTWLARSGWFTVLYDGEGLRYQERP